MVTRYNSVADFGADARKCWAAGSLSEFIDNEASYMALVDRCAYGDLELLPQAQQILEKINSQVANPERRQFVPAPFGAYAVVPEALAGVPCPMRRMYQQPDDRAPMNVYVSLSLSAGVGADASLRRGMAILALCMRMQQVRPCRLYLIEESDCNQFASERGHIQVIHMDTQPLNLAVAAFALGVERFARTLMYSNARRIGGSYAWPHRHRGADYIQWLRAHVGAGPRDILFSAMSLYDVETAEMISDPVKWVNKVIGRYNEAMEAM